MEGVKKRFRTAFRTFRNQSRAACDDSLIKCPVANAVLGKSIISRIRDALRMPAETQGLNYAKRLLIPICAIILQN